MTKFLLNRFPRMNVTQTVENFIELVIKRDKFAARSREIGKPGWCLVSEWVSEWVSVLLLIVIILRYCSIIRDVLDRDCSRDACKATRNWVHKSRRIIIIQAPLYNHHYHLSFCLVPSLQLSPRPRFDCLDAWRKRDSVQGPYIHKSYCFLCVDRGQNVPREWNMCLNIIMSRAIITLLFCGVILSELLLNFKQTN